MVLLFYLLALNKDFSDELAGIEDSEIPCVLVLCDSITHTYRTTSTVNAKESKGGEL